MKAPIIDAKDAHIEGAHFAFQSDNKNPIKEMHFECTLLPLHSKFQSGEDIVCGCLEGWHHAPVWPYMETHRDAETFVYTYGTALMPFCKVDAENNVIPGSAVIVRIPAGTQLYLEAGVAHFVAVAETDKFTCYVYAPDQPADRIYLNGVVEAE